MIEIADGDVDGGTTDVAHEMMVLVDRGQVIRAGTVPEVKVTNQPGTFEDIERSIDGR